MSHLVVPHRFHGPPRSGNGGWTAGSLAGFLPGDHRGATITVRLRLPPPLEVPLTVDDPPSGAGPLRILTDDLGRTVAEAVISETDLEPVAPVGVQSAVAAERDFPGWRRHPFPTCFVCGTERRSDDGLRIFPGPATTASGRVVAAAAWTPYATGTAITWAALDCPGAWSTDIVDRPMVLGTMTARVDRLPTTSDRYVVVAEHRGDEGRKTFTAASLYGEDGDLVATAEHVWIAIDPQTFGAADRS